jgi:hypothetical protein
MGEAFSALGALLLALALVGVHVVERSRALHVGLILCLAGIPLVLLWIGVLLVPIGLIVFGIGVARHNRAQRGPGVLLALSVVVGLLAWPILNGLIGHGEYASLVFLALMCPAWLWLGVVLLREPDGTG